MMDNSTMTDSLKRLWNYIVEDVRGLQNANGMVLNPVVGVPYLRETAFSAKIFVVNGIVFDHQSDLQWAERNLDCVKAELKNSIVFDEPVWTPRGVNYRKGSLPATILLLESVAESFALLGDTPDQYLDLQRLGHFLSACHIGNGAFAHDEVTEPEAKGYPVINTSAMALYAIGLMSEQGHDVALNPSKILNRLRQSQDSHGFWPYCLPLVVDGIFRRLLPGRLNHCYKKLSLSLLKDRSVYFGDYLHHAITLVYLLKYQYKIGFNDRSMVDRALGFIHRHSRAVDNSGTALCFDWEIKPSFPRYCNFVDVTTYFCIFKILSLCFRLGYLSKSATVEQACAYAQYILDYLKNDTLNPVIKPYQADEAIIRNILPRPAESVLHKGALMSNLMVDLYAKSTR